MIVIHSLRFYPGVASPGNDLPSINAGWSREAISDPQQTSQDFSEVDRLAEEELPTTPFGAASDDSSSTSYGRERAARVVTSPVAAARAPRVIGSFDHALLPVPPVSTLIDFRFLRLQA